MKRIVSLFLVLMITASLCACGRQDAADIPPNTAEAGVDGNLVGKGKIGTNELLALCVK